MGARAWTADVGYLFEPDEIAQHVERGAAVLTVSDDGYVRGVQPHDRAPLAALLRVEADLAEIIDRVEDLFDRVVATGTATAVEIGTLMRRVAALEQQ